MTRQEKAPAAKPGKLDELEQLFLDQSEYLLGPFVMHQPVDRSGLFLGTRPPSPSVIDPFRLRSCYDVVSAKAEELLDELNGYRFLDPPPSARWRDVAQELDRPAPGIGVGTEWERRNQKTLEVNRRRLVSRLRIRVDYMEDLSTGNKPKLPSDAQSEEGKAEFSFQHNVRQCAEAVEQSRMASATAPAPVAASILEKNPSGVFYYAGLTLLSEARASSDRRQRVRLLECARLAFETSVAEAIDRSNNGKASERRTPEFILAKREHTIATAYLAIQSELATYYPGGSARLQASHPPQFIAGLSTDTWFNGFCAELTNRFSQWHTELADHLAQACELHANRGERMAGVVEARERSLLAKLTAMDPFALWLDGTYRHSVWLPVFRDQLMQGGDPERPKNLLLECAAAPGFDQMRGPLTYAAWLPWSCTGKEASAKKIEAAERILEQNARLGGRLPAVANVLSSYLLQCARSRLQGKSPSLDDVGACREILAFLDRGDLGLDKRLANDVREIAEDATGKLLLITSQLDETTPEPEQNRILESIEKLNGDAEGAAKPESVPGFRITDEQRLTLAGLNLRTAKHAGPRAPAFYAQSLRGYWGLREKPGIAEKVPVNEMLHAAVGVERSSHKITPSLVNVMSWVIDGKRKADALSVGDAEDAYLQGLLTTGGRPSNEQFRNAAERLRRWADVYATGPAQRAGLTSVRKRFVQQVIKSEREGKAEAGDTEPIEVLGQLLLSWQSDGFKDVTAEYVAFASECRLNNVFSQIRHQRGPKAVRTAFESFAALRQLEQGLESDPAVVRRIRRTYRAAAAACESDQSAETIIKTFGEDVRDVELCRIVSDACLRAASRLPAANPEKRQLLDLADRFSSDTGRNGMSCLRRALAGIGSAPAQAIEEAQKIGLQESSPTDVWLSRYLTVVACQRLADLDPPHAGQLLEIAMIAGRQAEWTNDEFSESLLKLAVEVWYRPTGPSAEVARGIVVERVRQLLATQRYAEAARILDDVRFMDLDAYQRWLKARVGTQFPEDLALSESAGVPATGNARVAAQEVFGLVARDREEMKGLLRQGASLWTEGSGSFWETCEQLRNPEVPPRESMEAIRKDVTKRRVASLYLEYYYSKSTPEERRQILIRERARQCLATKQEQEPLTDSEEWFLWVIGGLAREPEATDAWFEQLKTWGHQIKRRDAGVLGELPDAWDALFRASRDSKARCNLWLLRAIFGSASNASMRAEDRVRSLYNALLTFQVDQPEYALVAELLRHEI